MEKRYRCANGVVERTRFFVGDNTRIFRGKRKCSKEWKQEQNLQSCVRKVARILNCNYTHENGLLVTLDLDEAGLDKLLASLDEKQREILSSFRSPVGQIGTWTSLSRSKKKGTAKTEPDPSAMARGLAVQGAMDALREKLGHALDLWLRRVKRKHGGKIKVLSVVSDMDHDTGEVVRCHCHVVFEAEGLSWDLLRKEWKLGSVDIRQLRKQQDFTPIAVYLMKQVRSQPEKKKYRVTQGMIKPEVEVRIVTGNEEIRVPAGAYVLERTEYHDDCYGQYIRYIPRKSSAKKRRE